METVYNGQTRRKSHIVVDAVLSRMRSGEWGAGIKLPSERDLAAEYHVSRTAVREALQALQLAGHVDTRLGEGSFIADPRAVEPSGDDPRSVAGLSITEALEAREALDMSSALMAVRRATRSDHLKLQAVVVEAEEHLARDDFKSYLLATLDMHILIAKSSHNPYLIRLVTELTDRHRDEQWVLHAHYTPDVAAFSLDVHRSLVDAIVKKDIPGVIDATARHYQDYPVLRGSRPQPSR